MKDIGLALNQVMQNKQCSPICAFVLLSENREEGDRHGIRKLQSKSETKTGRRLCDTGNF